MQKFDDLYGRYPYKQITLIDPEPDSAAAGDRYPTLIVGDMYWWTWVEPHGMETTIAHEFGHQYWYGMVATNEFEDHGSTRASTATAKTK